MGGNFLKGYVRDPATGEMVYREDIAAFEPDVEISIGDRIPVEDAYEVQWQRQQANGWGQEQQQEPQAVNVDLSQEGLARNAEAGQQLPQAREKLKAAVQEPSVRDWLNTGLKAVTGTSLDEIDAHLQAEAEGKPSPLSQDRL